MADKIQIVTPCGDGKYGLFTIVEGQVFRAWDSMRYRGPDHGIGKSSTAGWKYFKLIQEMFWFCSERSALNLFIHEDFDRSNRASCYILQREIIKSIDHCMERHYSSKSGYYELHIHEDEINAVRDNPSLFQVLDNYIPEPKSDSWRYSIGDVYAK